MIKLIIFFLAAVSVTCGSTGSIASNAPITETQLTDGPKAAATREPGEVVRDFMNLVSSGEEEKANDLMSRAEKPALGAGPSTQNNSLVEVPVRLDWVRVLGERAFVLQKIADETVQGEKAEVRAELGVNDLKDFTQKAVFHLQKEDRRWVISSIDLVFDAPRQPEKKEAESN